MKFSSHLSTSDMERPQLYWSNKSGGFNLERLNTDGTDNRIILYSDADLRVDAGICHHKNKMYFVNGDYPDRIAVANLNGSNYKVLLSGAGEVSVNITVCDDGIFWSEYASGVGRINRCDLDGANESEIRSVSGNFNAVENDGAHLYFLERVGNLNNLKRMDFDGTNVTTIVADSVLENNSPARGLDLKGSYIYWVNQGTTAADARIMRCDKNGSNVTTIVSTSDALEKGFFSIKVGETEIYYLVAFGSPHDEGIFKCNLDGTNFPTTLLGGEPYPWNLELA
jgi:hypothetical protein